MAVDEGSGGCDHLLPRESDCFFLLVSSQGQHVMVQHD